MVRLWIDTDAGDNPDDELAILAATSHPDIDLVGISTVSGDVGWRAEFVRGLLNEVGVPVPLVYAGPPDPRALAAAEALLAIGPLSNLAALMRLGVDLPPTAVMGGAFEPTIHRGELCDLETNFVADPLAAAVVLAEASDLLIVPLDVTATMVMNANTVARLESIPALGRSLTAWRSRDRAIVAHDPLALLALVGEHVSVGRKRVAVTVEGRSVVDERDGTAVAVLTGCADPVNPT